MKLLSGIGLARIIHCFETEELKSFNGKPKATACMSHRAIHRAIEAAVAFGLPLNEFGSFSFDDHE